MSFITELWLPIVLSAVFVFIVSIITHMVLPYHRSNVTKVPNEAAVLDALRANGVGPGAYMFPHCDSAKEWNSPETKAKLEQGPMGLLTVMPSGGFNMGKSMMWWFVQCLLMSVLVAYLGWNSLGEGAAYLKVFQITGAAAVMGYAVAQMHESIWKGQRWSTTWKFMFDGVVYALATAGTFGWLWPELG